MKMDDAATGYSGDKLAQKIKRLIGDAERPDLMLMSSGSPQPNCVMSPDPRRDKVVVGCNNLIRAALVRLHKHGQRQARHIAISPEAFLGGKHLELGMNDRERAIFKKNIGSLNADIEKAVIVVLAFAAEMRPLPKSSATLSHLRTICQKHLVRVLDIKTDIPELQCEADDAATIDVVRKFEEALEARIKLIEEQIRWIDEALDAERSPHPLQ